MTNNTSIKNSWSLVAFAKDFGSAGVRVGQCANHKTGEVFDAVAFTDKAGNRTFASFSPKLGNLTAQELVAQKAGLQVVLCETKEGRDMYSICRQGEGTWGEEVDLF